MGRRHGLKAQMPVVWLHRLTKKTKMEMAARLKTDKINMWAEGKTKADPCRR